MRIGIDLGGTKIELVVLDKKDSIIYTQRCDTPSASYSRTVDAIAELVVAAEVELNTGSLTVGMCTPGIESPDSGLMKNCNSTCLNGQPLRRDLSARLGREVRIANDANCFALSEAADGAAAGKSSVFAAILGTGVGAGLVINGQIIPGTNGIAGEWGHNPMPLVNAKDKRSCYCGSENCVETFLSGFGLVKTYIEKGGNKLPVEQLVTHAMAQQATAIEALASYQRQLAAALSVVINIVDPEVIVLGGGLSNIDSLYTAVPELWLETIFSDRVRTQLLRPLYGDSSGVRGAARLW